MSNDLISRSVLLEKIRICKKAVSDCANYDYLIGYASALSGVEGQISAEPAVDAEPVRHGRWIERVETIAWCEDDADIEYVDPRMIDIMKELVDNYNAEQTAENYLKVLYSNPVGFRLTARMTTNYRQLKTMYNQRKAHRIPEWRWFCKWIETLPRSEFITGQIGGGQT